MFAFELDVNRYGQICVSVGVHMVVCSIGSALSSKAGVTFVFIKCS